MSALFHAVVAFLATWFLLAAAAGLLDQSRLIYKHKNSEAVSRWRFAGIYAANVVWVLIALASPGINYPLFIGCLAMVLVALVTMQLVLRYPPACSARFRAGSQALSLGGIIVLGFFFMKRELLFPYKDALGLCGVVASFVLIHAGSIDQLRVNARRGTVSGLSFWNWSLHWLDWAIWVLYPILLGFREHWAACVNAAFGLVLTTLVLVQYRQLRNK